MTISSDITTEFCIKVLKSGMDQILKYIQSQQTTHTNQDNTGQGNKNSIPKCSADFLTEEAGE